MLKMRVIAALVAAPLVIFALFFTSPISFALVFLVLASVALYEWGNLAGLTGLIEKAVYLLVFWCLAYSIYNSGYEKTLLDLSALFWLVAVFMVLAHPRGQFWLNVPALHLGVGLLVLAGAWLGLVGIKALPEGEWLLVWVMILVWGADVGAYFSGKAFGKNKLAPAISPGKTWEGVVGGIAVSLAATLIMVLYIPAFGAIGLPVWLWLVLAVGLAALSVTGDLFESVLKRHAGIKDSGSIFPGHGGLLDRIDALIAVIPVFLCIFYLLGFPGTQCAIFLR